MQTLSKLIAKLVDNVNEVCNHSVTSSDVERAAILIDDYLRETWDCMLDDSTDPWRVIMQAFANTHADEEDNIVTFTSYMILTQCMLKDKMK